MFRGLDYRTEESEIKEALTKLTSIVIKDIRLIRDKYSGKSRGFAFIEVNTVAVSLNEYRMNFISNLTDAHNDISRQCRACEKNHFSPFRTVNR